MEHTPIDTLSAEHYTWGENCSGWHLLRSAQLSVIEESMPPGTSETRHYHEKSQQFFYILEGSARFEIGDELVTLHARQGLPVAAGTPHRIFNDSQEALRFLVISSPPAQGDRFPA